MNNLTNKIIEIIRSPKFFIGVMLLFALQGLLFAVIVNPSTISTDDSGYQTRSGGVVPDGNRHIAAIYYYAQQPLANGPLIHDMDDRDLWMGDLERFPSYLYYYLLSFPVRTALSLGANDAFVVTLIRLVGLVFGLVALWTLRKLALELKFGRVVANLSTLAMAVTGSFVWLSVAENYDIPALMFWLLFLLACARLFMRRDARYLYWMALWFFLVSITKYTYIPFSGLAGLAAFWIFARQIGYRSVWETIKRHWRNWRKEIGKYTVAGLAVLLIVSGILFIERVGGNLMFYRAFNPSCTRIHTHEACMKFGVYERNYNRAIEYERQIESGEVQPTTYNPLTYTPFWLNRYYTSMYGYVGHIWIYQFWSWMYVGLTAALVAVAGLLMYAKKQRQRLFKSAAEKWLAGVVVMLVIAQYIFNVQTFVNFGGERYAYAHQGRYLLSAIGLIYMLVLLLAARVIYMLSDKSKTTVVLVLIAIGLLVLITNSALVSFFVHADSLDWFSPAARQTLPDFLLPN